MKLYIIVDCMSGADHSVDDPYVYEACLSLEKAKIDFENIISDIEDGFSDNCDHGFSDDGMTYEFTDFDNDEHGILKIVEREVKQ